MQARMRGARAASQQRKEASWRAWSGSCSARRANSGARHRLSSGTSSPSSATCRHQVHTAATVKALRRGVTGAVGGSVGRGSPAARRRRIGCLAPIDLAVSPLLCTCWQTLDPLTTRHAARLSRGARPCRAPLERPRVRDHLSCKGRAAKTWSRASRGAELHPASTTSSTPCCISVDRCQASSGWVERPVGCVVGRHAAALLCLQPRLQRQLVRLALQK